MPFSRLATAPVASVAPLTARLIGIGMSFEGEGDTGADIEGSLVEASVVGMDGDDLRVLSVLTTWLGFHHDHVHADRLIRLVTGSASSSRVRAYWSAVASWLGDRRFARLLRLHGPSPSSPASPASSEGTIPVDLLTIGTDFQLSRRGEDPRFVGSALRVPAGTLRDRPSDVLTPSSLIRLHPGYRNRVLMGPSWRADVWTVLERDPSLTPSDVARAVGCSFSTAWQVARDFALLHQLISSENVTRINHGILG